MRTCRCATNAPCARASPVRRRCRGGAMSAAACKHGGACVPRCGWARSGGGGGSGGNAAASPAGCARGDAAAVPRQCCTHAQ
jgi:hypothetical protein